MRMRDGYGHRVNSQSLGQGDLPHLHRVSVLYRLQLSSHVDQYLLVLKEMVVFDIQRMDIHDEQEFRRYRVLDLERPLQSELVSRPREGPISPVSDMTQQ